MRDRSRRKRWALSIGVILASIAFFIFMVKTKPEPPRAAPAAEGTLVEVATVQPVDHEIAVQAKGTVVAAKEVLLQPELAGRVTWQSPELIPGGRLAKGDPILKIDARDYRLAVEGGKAELNKAQLEFALERRRGDVAKKEWETFGDKEAGEQQKALALREPQLASAKVTVSAARSSLKKAQLDLARTTLKAPFNSMVVSESVDLGQLISAQTTVAKLVGTDQFRVQVSVPISTLASIRVRGSGQPGSAATVTQRVGDQTITREGEVIRQLPDLDPGGAMARVLVSIKEPIGSGDGLPLLLGSYVNVDIDAGEMQSVVKVPRAAIRDGKRVFVMNAESKLEIRNVDIVWGLPDSVLVGSGLKAGEHIVVSRIGTPVPNMLLRTAKESSAAGNASAPSAKVSSD